MLSFFSKFISNSCRSSHSNRVVRQADGENNFHVFYYLLAGVNESMRKRLELSDVVSYHYLRGGCPGVTHDAAIDFGLPLCQLITSICCFLCLCVCVCVFVCVS